MESVSREDIAAGPLGHEKNSSIISKSSFLFPYLNDHHRQKLHLSISLLQS